MNFFRKLIADRNSLPLVVVIFASVLAGRSLLFEKGYFNMHDDLQMMRQLEMEKCFLDGQVPCRWVPDMGYAFGFPLFNFYPPLPYLVGELFRVFGLSFVETAKMTFALALILSGVTMYFLSKEFFGKAGAVLSSVFYIWAPYHAVDIYVRGAMNEAWALVFFPLILWSSYRLITGEKTQNYKWQILLSLSYAGLLLSHNLMVLMFTPFFILWILLWLWNYRAWKKILPLLFSGIGAFAVSAFFTLPALIENSLTKVKNQVVGEFGFAGHFVTLSQLLISRFWGYGGSYWEEKNDAMSFQIGHVHWILSLLVAVIVLIFLLRKKGNLLMRLKSDKRFLALFFSLFIGWMSAFLTHNRSTFIYTSLPQLQYIQFPWRFLTIVIFAFSFMVGYLPSLIHSTKRFFDFAAAPFRMTITIFLSILIIIVNWNYFRPANGHMGPLTDNEKFSGEAWRLQQGAGILDYLPATAKEAPLGPEKSLADVVEGQGSVSGFQKGTYWGKFVANVTTDEARIRINTFYFPQWRVFVRDGQTSKEIATFIPEEEKNGRMWVGLPKGEHFVYFQFFNTPVRTVANLITLASIVTLSAFFWNKTRLQANSNKGAR